jgi:hypothetical protein
MKQNQIPNNPKEKTIFKTNHIPNDKFSLFNNTDYFHFSKKFQNTLFNDTFPTKSLNYLPTNDKLNEFNPDIMVLGLTNIADICTNFNINANLEKDFMQCSINTLYNNAYVKPEGKNLILIEYYLKILI